MQANGPTEGNSIFYTCLWMNLHVDSFLRHLLLRTARRYYRKGRLNDATETLCQLIVATRGYLNDEEMWSLFAIFKKKIECTLEFYSRMSSSIVNVSTTLITKKQAGCLGERGFKICYRRTIGHCGGRSSGGMRRTVRNRHEDTARSGR
jgi:hypothetical protein